MIDRGVNPFIVQYAGITQYNRWSLTSLSNLPQQKSIYFLVKPFDALQHEPWHYETGIFPGEFNDVIGSGGESVVIGGILNGEEVAYKYVDIGQQTHTSTVSEGLADMTTRLNEMHQMESITGSCILSIKGHFR